MKISKLSQVLSPDRQEAAGRVIGEDAAKMAKIRMEAIRDIYSLINDEIVKWETIADGVNASRQQGNLDPAAIENLNHARGMKGALHEIGWFLEKYDPNSVIP